MGDPSRVIPVIVGPTAIGKTSLVMELASHRPVTVISADSRQVYRRLDIGTAKPSAEERAAVPHYGVDVLDPVEPYSAGRFARDAARWLADVPRERFPIVVGGTGFYVRALVDGLFHEPPMSDLARRRFRRWVQTAPSLAGWAARLDQGFTGGGRQRAARTVEVALLTGRSLTWWQQQAKQDGLFRPWFVRLTAPRPIIHRRIADRVQQMLDGGLVDEVRDLLAAGVPANAPGLNSVGYKEVVQYLEGHLEESQLAASINVSTRRYAKRQETWFRHQLQPHEVITLDFTGEPKTVATRLWELWDSRRFE